jgi:hypothetical protein
VWDRKDPLTRESYFDLDRGSPGGLPLDPDEETPARKPTALFAVRA